MATSYPISIQWFILQLLKIPGSNLHATPINVNGNYVNIQSSYMALKLLVQQLSLSTSLNLHKQLMSH